MPLSLIFDRVIAPNKLKNSIDFKLGKHKQGLALLFCENLFVYFVFRKDK